MPREHGLLEEYKNNGLQGVAKRLAYYLPNHYVIHQVKTTELSYGLNNIETREKHIIVSLTSYPARLPNIYLCLKSLLLQTVKPDKIILWFGCDTKRENLTQDMLDLEQYGIEYPLTRKTTSSLTKNIIMLCGNSQTISLLLLMMMLCIPQGR